MPLIIPEMNLYLFILRLSSSLHREHHRVKALQLCVGKATVPRDVSRSSGRHTPSLSFLSTFLVSGSKVQRLLCMSNTQAQILNASKHPWFALVNNENFLQFFSHYKNFRTNFTLFFQGINWGTKNDRVQVRKSSSKLPSLPRPGCMALIS